MKNSLVHWASHSTSAALLGAALWVFAGPSTAQDPIDPVLIECTCLLKFSGPFDLTQSMPPAIVPPCFQGATVSFVFTPLNDGRCDTGACAGQAERCYYSIVVTVQTTSDCCLTITCGNASGLITRKNTCTTSLTLQNSGHGALLDCGERNFYRVYAMDPTCPDTGADCIGPQTQQTYVRVSCVAGADC